MFTTRTLTRRAFTSLAAASAVAFARQRPDDAKVRSRDWMCPMDRDVRSASPGVCPRCGMKLVLSVAEFSEYPISISHPQPLRPNRPTTLSIQVLDPKTERTVDRFEVVHEKLMHLFLVSENLEFFAHDHPALQSSGCFNLDVTFPFGGMYRLLADFYPAASVPQLAVSTLYVSGEARAAKLVPALTPSGGINLSANLRIDPQQALAGLETKLFFCLEPSSGLEPYLGAPAHMLAASADLIDLLHLHPFLANGAEIQFNVIFPRAGLYRVWTQFQRKGVVNTVSVTIPVTAL